MAKNGIEKSQDHAAGIEIAIDALHEKMLRIIERSISQKGMSSHFDAEDVLQETVVSLLRQRRTLSNVKDIQGYLVSACNNRLKSMMRSMLQKKRTINRNVYFDGLREAESSQVSSEDEIIRNEDAEMIIHLVETRLPDDQRKVIQMYYFDEMSVSQIAEITNKTRDSVTALAKRARARLKGSLQGIEKCKRQERHRSSL